jgi:hypothetical protein
MRLGRRSTDRDWCAPCLVEWSKKPLEERKRTQPSRKVTTIRGIPVCSDCAETELERARGVA